MDSALLIAAPGVTFPGCAVGEGPLGRGLMATRSVGMFMKEPVLRVPIEESIALCVDGREHKRDRRVQSTAMDKEMGVGAAVRVSAGGGPSATIVSCFPVSSP